LGYTLVRLGNHEMAEESLNEVAAIVENVGQMAGWRHLPELYVFLAANHLAQNQLETAVEYARKAHDLAGRLGDVELIGLTWCMLGRVIAQLPLYQRPIQIGDGRYDAADCFAKSLQLFETINGGGVASHRDQAYTLWHWAMLETANGQSERAHNLQKRAESLARPLGLALV
jgi:tetratricopeptide (TPR) repeat protein